MDLKQFYINFSKKEHFIGLDQLLKFSGFSLYPLSFSLNTVPFMKLGLMPHPPAAPRIPNLKNVKNKYH